MTVKKTAKENVTFPNPTPLPVTGSHLNPGMDPVLAAKVLLNDLRMQRIDREIANGALDWLSRHNGIDAQELIRRSADHQSPVYGNPIATDADQLDLLVTSTIDNERWPTALPLQARAADQFFNANLEVKRKLIRTTVHRMGLTVTSETGGTHTKNSLHYRGLAIDVAGAPSEMERFFKVFARHAEGGGVVELFYDPLGSYNDGRRGGAIGNHGDHVQIGFMAPPKQFT
jgi:hypothetical protein